MEWGLRLIEEIERQAPVFDALDASFLSAVASPEIRNILRVKNGALALSGALVLFGCGHDHSAPMHLARFKSWVGRTDYDLEESDDVFAADVFGDLLFARNGEVFRLDGETGEHVWLGDVAAFFDQQISDVAEQLGGNLGRDHFAHRAIGSDPLRLLPFVPFIVRENTPGAFFETPLWRAVALKHRLFLACRGLADGSSIGLSFWKA